MNIVVDNLLNKYSPKKIKDIIGSKNQINNIISWLNDFKKNKLIYHRNLKKTKSKNKNIFSSMIVTGDNGTGKTTIINTILNDMKYTIKTINFHKIKNNTNIIEQIITSGYISNIRHHNNNNIVIVVDELEYLGSPIEKNIITNILKSNSTKWICPIIFMGNNKHKKIISLVKKESYNIKLYQPTDNNMMRLLERICIGEKILFEEDMRIINKIIEHSQQDYRRLIVILGELFRLYNNTIITYDMINKYLIYVGNKDIDMTIYQNTTKLFTEFSNISTSLKIFDSDKTNMPLMVHQNYFTIINNYNNYGNTDISNSISESISQGDIIDNYIYSEQNWNLQEIYGYYACVYPSYMINTNLDIKSLQRDILYPKHMPKYVSAYPKDYNKTSTKRINYKNIKFANNFFVNINIYDYIYISKYIKFMLSNNKIAECKLILEKYNISITGLMYILKIDKITGTKKDITKELEKKLKAITNEPVKKLISKR